MFGILDIVFFLGEIIHRPQTLEQLVQNENVYILNLHSIPSGYFVQLVEFIELRGDGSFQEVSRVFVDQNGRLSEFALFHPESAPGDADSLHATSVVSKLAESSSQVRAGDITPGENGCFFVVNFSNCTIHPETNEVCCAQSGSYICPDGTYCSTGAFRCEDSDGNVTECQVKVKCRNLYGGGLGEPPIPWGDDPEWMEADLKSPEVVEVTYDCTGDELVPVRTSGR